MWSEIEVAKQVISHWREKLLARSEVPVPQTDTGRQGENPKTNGRTLVKELGKMTPVTSGEGVLQRCSRREESQATV